MDGEHGVMRGPVGRSDECKTHRSSLAGLALVLSLGLALVSAGYPIMPTALKRHRAGDADENVITGIHLTINGLAAGLRNSG